MRLNYAKRKAKKALKIAKESGLTQVTACIEIGVSVPTYKKLMNEGVLPKDPEKCVSIIKWIIKQLTKESKCQEK